MHRSILMLALAAAALWSAPALAQARSQLGPLCTTDTTPADQQIDACNKIIALKVFSGEKLATIYFWRAVGWNKKGNYSQVISDASEALRLKPDIAQSDRRLRFRDLIQGARPCAALEPCAAHSAILRGAAKPPLLRIRPLRVANSPDCLATYLPQTSLATSTASLSLAHCSSSVSRLPSSVEAKPHCGDTAS